MGSMFHLNTGFYCLQQAIRSAEKETSAWALATMEEEIARRQNKEVFNYQLLSTAYDIIIKLSPNAGGADRAATVSWWFVKESLHIGNREAVQKGLNNLKKACQQQSRNWLEFPLNDLKLAVANQAQRITLPNPIDLELFNLEV